MYFYQIMEQKKWNVIGLMSGTSLDGVDLIYTTFTFSKKYNYKVHLAKTYNYTDEWRAKLSNAYEQSKQEIELLHQEYGVFLGSLINEFIDEFSIHEIDFIASHGHTIFHRPQEQYTLQIGDGQLIANKTSLKVVCDFRTQDVMLGGQGAPLVPIGDLFLFSEYDYCLNLGGFANISYQEKDVRKAFDICPVNVVLNYYAQKLGKPFDENGTIAASGIIYNELLNELNMLPFYVGKTPKSLGVEFVKSTILPILNKYSLPEADVLKTFVEHIAINISTKVKPNKKILITGGGTYNNYLIERIKLHTGCDCVIPSKELIDFKEALIFAFLGVRRLENKYNCLKSVTGASKDHSSGVIFIP